MNMIPQTILTNKSAIVPNVKGGNPLAYNEGIRQLKLLGWQSTGQQHPEHNTSVLQLGECYIWKDAKQRYDWLLDTPTVGVIGVDGNIANITEEAKKYSNICLCCNKSATGLDGLCDDCLVAAEAVDKAELVEYLEPSSGLEDILNGPIWSVESAAGYTASVERDGQVSYAGHNEPEPEQPAVEWSELKRLAWRNGRATHHVNGQTFYRKVPGGVEVCEWDGEAFTEWQRHWAGIPELAEPL